MSFPANTERLELPPEWEGALDLPPYPRFVLMGRLEPSAGSPLRWGIEIAVLSTEEVCLGSVAQVAGYRGDVRWVRLRQALYLRAYAQGSAAHFETAAGESRVAIWARGALEVYEPDEQPGRVALGELVALNDGDPELAAELEERMPVPPPEDSEELEAWLLELERCRLAAAAAERERPSVAALLKPLVDSRRAALEGRPGAWRRARRFPLLLPTATASGGVGALRESDALSAWAAGELHVEDSESLRALVSRAGTWQREYREQLRRASAEAFVDAVESGGGLPLARAVVLRVPLPHLGDDVAAEVLQHGAQLTVEVAPTGGVLGRARIPESAAGAGAALPVTLDWGDATTGPLVTTLQVRAVTEETRLLASIDRLEALACEDGMLAASSDELAGEARRLCERLPASAAAAAFARGAACFDAGEAPDAATRAGVLTTLRARCCLEAAAHALYSEPELHLQLALDLDRLDARLAPSAGALLLLERDTYCGVLERAFGDEAETVARGEANWWALPARLGSELPDRVVDAALRGQALPQTRVEPVARVRALTVSRIPERQYAAAAASGQPGEELIPELQLPDGGVVRAYRDHRGQPLAVVTLPDAQRARLGLTAAVSLRLEWNVAGQSYGALLRPSERGWRGAVDESIREAAQLDLLPGSEDVHGD